MIPEARFLLSHSCVRICSQYKVSYTIHSVRQQSAARVKCWVTHSLIVVLAAYENDGLENECVTLEGETAVPLLLLLPRVLLYPEPRAFPLQSTSHD